MGNADHLKNYRFKPGEKRPPRDRSGHSTLSKATRQRVGEDGDVLVELWLSIAMDPMRRDADRIRASELLAERGWGKAATFTAQEGDPLGLEDATEAAEEFRRNILRLADAGGAGEAS